MGFLILYYIFYILYHDYTNTALKQPNQLCMSKCGEQLVAVWMFEHQTAEKLIDRTEDISNNALFYFSLKRQCFYSYRSCFGHAELNGNFN